MTKVARDGRPLSDENWTGDGINQALELNHNSKSIAQSFR
jgi:hypothetical protein